MVETQNSIMKGTLEDFLTAAESLNGKIVLVLPCVRRVPPCGVSLNSYASEVAACVAMSPYYASEKSFLRHFRQLQSHLVRWVTSETASATLYWRMAPDGFGTTLTVDTGTVWLVISREPPLVETSLKPWTMRFLTHIQRERLNELQMDPLSWCRPTVPGCTTEGYTLHAGSQRSVAAKLILFDLVLIHWCDRVFIPPNTVFLIHCKTETVITGEYFYCAKQLRSILPGLLHAFILGKPLAPTHHPESRRLLCEMMLFTFDSIVRGKNNDSGMLLAFVGCLGLSD
jgi:hypothetical protein